jgi:hypothetical protein
VAPLASPLFAAADETAELFVVGPLAGCSGASYLAAGALDRHLGAFAAVVPVTPAAGPAAGPAAMPGWRAPSLAPGDRTIIFSTASAPASLFFATRGAVDTQFAAAQPLTLAVGNADDRQLAVDATCKVAYLVSQRPGGSGGYDLYVADVTP